MKLTDAFIQYKTEIEPLFRPGLDPSNTLLLDLSGENENLKSLTFDNTQQLGDYIFRLMEKQGKVYACGGYMENRAVYQRSTLFGQTGEKARSLHLGIDVWAPANTPVYLPLDGKVHSYQHNDQFGDYGPTIIMEHHWQGHRFHTLYGHLSLQSLDGLQVNLPMQAGKLLCHIGDAPVNGDWPPHLHFQIITDMMNKWGDFPGVCTPDEAGYWKQICPNPSYFFENLNET